jgi:hypothetical protein
MAAGAVSYANYSVLAGADTRVKGFADAYRKGEKSTTKGIVYYKDKKGKQKRKKIITSPVKAELRRS